MWGVGAHVLCVRGALCALCSAGVCWRGCCGLGSRDAPALPLWVCIVGRVPAGRVPAFYGVPSPVHPGCQPSVLPLLLLAAALAASRPQLLPPLPTSQALPIPSPSPQPSRLCPVLTHDLHICCRETLPNWDAEIADDVRDECSKYGPVQHIYVDPSSQGFVYL